MTHHVYSLGFVLQVCLSATTLHAQILHYTDDKGRRIYVDNISKVPQQYRNQLEVRGTQLTPERRNELDLKRQEQQNVQQLQQHLRQLDQAISALHTPLTMRGNSVMLPVKVTLQGRTANTLMILDTGASSTAFHRDKLSRLPIDARPSGYAQVASGDLIETFSARFDRIEIGPYRIDGPRASIIDFQGSGAHDGLLGMDFLRRVDYRIDFEASQIIWDPTRIAELKQQRVDLEAAIVALTDATQTPE
ncbi:retropepsin-like aspartic protease family protein [Nitrincola tibetensis]|nr:retropepsin-like aspartic protease [Nitrincola tibetensis]